ncbi:hypothetical protein ACHAXT_005503 [Thalassiosira profunda]
MTLEQSAPDDVEAAAAAAPQAASADAGVFAANGDEPSKPTDSNTSLAQERKLSRKLSISEMAQEQSTRRCPPPKYLRWIEWPFRVKNIQTHQYVEEATGHAMDHASRGPINQTGSFIGSAMIRFAAMEAGGANNVVFGNTKASSLLTVASLIVGVTAGVTMPFVGALVDHTNHRKAMGAVSAVIIVIAVGFQLMLNEDTWFAIFILEIIGGYFLIMHQVCTMAYLPDLTHDLDEMGHYTAHFMMKQYGVQAIFTSILIAVSFTRDFTNLQTAKLAAGMATALGVVNMGYAWTFLFRKRPKLREVPEGSNLYTTGFKQLMSTAKVVFKNYRALKWFMIALLFSPEAGAGVVLSIAVTFVTFLVQMSVREISIVSLILLITTVPGAYLSKLMCRWINPLNSFRCAEILFAIGNALFAGLVTGSTQRDKYLVYTFGGILGVALGWMFPSQRTLAVALIPKGQETEIMGLISFFGQIVGWLPAFVFTAMNQNGVSMRWGVSTISWFLLVSCFFTLFCGKFEDAVALVAESSDEYLHSFSKRGGGGSFADVGASEKSEVAVATADSGEKEVVA